MNNVDLTAAEKLAREVDFEKRRKVVTENIDELMRVNEIGIQRKLIYNNDAIVPAIMFVDIKKYDEPTKENDGKEKEPKQDSKKKA